MRHLSFSICHLSFAVLLLITTVLYAHALDFGFIWDDPLCYGRVVGRSVGELPCPIIISTASRWCSTIAWLFGISRGAQSGCVTRVPYLGMRVNSTQTRGWHTLSERNCSDPAQRGFATPDF